MTSDQKMDRVERMARLLCEPDLRSVRVWRQQTEKLILLLERQKKNDGPVANPETDKQIEKLKRQLRVHVRNEATLTKASELEKRQPDSDSSERDR